MKKVCYAFIIAFLLAATFSCSRNTINVTQKDNSEIDLVDSVAKVFDSVVSIRDDARILGSGFVMDNKIITASHVLYDKDKTYTVIIADGTIFESQILSFDEIKDIAFLNLPPTANRLPLTSVVVSKSDNLELGQSIFTIGYNAGFEFSVLKGIISGKDRTLIINNFNQNLSLKNVLQIDMNGSLGLSGAPLFNLNGELLGMINAVDEKTGTVFGTKVLGTSY